MAERIPRWRTGGLAALVGALLWGIKSGSILLAGHQPPVVFEAAPALFGLAVVSLASGRTARLARTAQALGGSACMAGVVALSSELTGDVWGPALAAAMAGVILGLTMIGLTTRRESGPGGTTGRLALALGVTTVPAVVVGGLLSTISERLLEAPLLVLAYMWAWLGVLMLRAQDR